MKDLRLPGAAWLANSLANLHPAAKLLTPVLAFSAMVMPAQAATNLVQNGSFENNLGPGATEFNDANYTIRGKLPNWTMNTGNTGFMGLDSYATATTNTYITNCSIPGSPPSCSSGDVRSIRLWGATPGWQNGNGFQGSPDGGYFWIADGNATYRGFLAQEITGLTVGAKYDLSFYNAYTQEACSGCNGQTIQSWVVSFGDETFSTNSVTVPEHAFIDWVNTSHTFTATSVTQTLKFVAVSNGSPPMALLDGVSLTQNPVPGPLPVAGVAAVLGFSRKLRRRIKLG
jgi:hypothetical protein